MADVMNRDRGGDSAGNDGRRDRGQLILVTGLAVAVTMVALVLLLNTVIYTQNLATRGAEIEDSEAISFRQEAIEGVGEVVDAENREEYDNHTLVRQNITDGITRFDGLASRYRAERGTIADVNESTVSYTNGTLLRQTNASRDFTSAGNDAAVNWTLAEDVGASNAPGTRNFQLTVSGENLSSSDSTAFSVRLANDSETWQVSVYNNSNDHIVVKNGTGDTIPNQCIVSGPDATIDLTAGTINGSACPELTYPSNMTAYSISFRNGNRATGTYALTVRNSTQASVDKSNFAEPGNSSSPRWAPAVYAAEFEIRFETPDVAFDTTVRTAPGEPE
jgi:hypothetical protein